MVRLDRIYTRGGDEGLTSLGDGSRVAKHDLRVAAYGTVDELSSVIGLAIAHGVPEPIRSDLVAIQNELFDVGADLCVPIAPPTSDGGRDRLRITPEYTERLERLIDRENEPLPPLKSFVLPGGTHASAWMHFARNVCRRAERLVTELVATPGEAERTNAEVVKYLNRLSDLLFVLGRALNGGGAHDVLWIPGKGRAR